MKKFLTLTMLLGSIAFAAPSAEAKTVESQSRSVEINAASQDRWERNDRYERDRRYNNRDRVRIETRTRIIRIGRQRYRETLQIRYLPNGRTQTRIVSRARLR